MEGKTKASVPAVTACFADPDLGGEGSDEALAELTSGSVPVPSFVVNSGYGLHAVCVVSSRLFVQQLSRSTVAGSFRCTLGGRQRIAVSIGTCRYRSMTCDAIM